MKPCLNDSFIIYFRWLLNKYPVTEFNSGQDWWVTLMFDFKKFKSILLCNISSLSIKWLVLNNIYFAGNVNFKDLKTWNNWHRRNLTVPSTGCFDFSGSHRLNTESDAVMTFRIFQNNSKGKLGGFSKTCNNQPERNRNRSDRQNIFGFKTSEYFNLLILKVPLFKTNLGRNPSYTPAVSNANLST